MSHPSGFRGVNVTSISPRLCCASVCFLSGGFHGRTTGALALTSSKYVYGAGFGPFMSGVHRVPFPYCLRCPGMDHCLLTYRSRTCKEPSVWLLPLMLPIPTYE